MKHPVPGKRTSRSNPNVSVATITGMILTVLLCGFLGLNDSLYSSVSWAASPSWPIPLVSIESKNFSINRSQAGFASRQKLIAHYEKHGREFGDISMEEYLLQAKTLRDRPAGGMVLELVRSDGVITRFDRTTGDFIAFNPDGLIRTFFRPSAGEAYFRRQARDKK